MNLNLSNKGFEHTNPIEKEKLVLKELKSSVQEAKVLISMDSEFRTENPEQELSEEQFLEIYESSKWPKFIKERFNGEYPEIPQEVNDVIKIIPQSRKNLSIEKVNEEIDLLTFLENSRKYTRNHWEAKSRDLLSYAEKKYDAIASSKFTTSTQGSQSAHEEKSEGPQYDSVYYTFSLSNGTQMSKRFKMAMIRNHGLKEVLADEIADMCIFDSESATPKYSLRPKLGANITEYFSEVMVDQQKNNLDLAPVHMEVGDLSENILNRINESNWKYIHEGTKVNKIIFNK